MHTHIYSASQVLPPLAWEVVYTQHWPQPLLILCFDAFSKSELRKRLTQLCVKSTMCAQPRAAHSLSALEAGTWCAEGNVNIVVLSILNKEEEH